MLAKLSTIKKSAVTWNMLGKVVDGSRDTSKHSGWCKRLFLYMRVGN